jgi:flagellar basal-body rod protein FlgC
MTKLTSSISIALLVAASSISSANVPTQAPAKTTTTAPATSATNSVANDFSCPDLRKATLKLPVYAANIANAKTTRTPEGGPYKRVELKCKELYCESIPQEDFRLVYEPTNPDANHSGYVSYPHINTSMEYTALNSAATELKLLASKEVCGVKSILSNNSSLVKYDAGSSIQSDTFIFNADGRLSTWTRTLRDGTMQNYSFNTTDGTLITN